MSDHHLGHLFWTGEVAQALEALEHHQEGELLALTAAGGTLRKVDLTEGRGVEAGELLGGGISSEPGIGGAFDQGQDWPRAAYKFTATYLVSRYSSIPS